jgi:hypothetical protein
MVPKRRTETRPAAVLGIILFMGLALGGCGGGSTISCKTTACSVTVSWAANREAAVNSSGGGYTLYYSNTPGFNLTDSGVTSVPVPFNGTATPTSTTLSLFSGTYYFKVVAYSALNPPGGSGGSTSAPSAQQSLTLP